MEHRYVYSTGYFLKTDADFMNAIWFDLKIDLYKNGSCMDHSCSIESFDELSVQINGGYFLRSNCSFVVQ